VQLRVLRRDGDEETEATARKRLRPTDNQAGCGLTRACSRQAGAGRLRSGAGLLTAKPRQRRFVWAVG
jgi:hypothetical protein